MENVGNYTGVQEYLVELKEQRYDSRVDHFIKEIRVLNLPKSQKALQLLLEEMTAKKGFQRHDGRDYFVHPIMVAQTALDYGIIGSLIQNNDSKKADIIIASCLLHDIIEDVEFITEDTVREMFGVDVMLNVSNVSKREDEAFVDYIKRFSSSEISSLVKILDRLHNVSTLDKSSLAHRKRQLQETREIYIPLTKVFRRKYWQYGDFYFQSRITMVSVLNEIERSILAEEKVLDLEKQIKELQKKKV